jgi:hypothetical protein
MDERKSSLFDSGAVLAAATGFLYCASAAYYGGYFRVFQLDADVLDRNFNQSLYNGFAISWVPAFLSLFYYAALRFLYAYLLLPALNDWLHHGILNKRRFLKLKHRAWGKRKDSKIVRSQKKHTLKFAFYIVVFLALILSLVHFESKGKEEATSARNKVESKTFLPSDIITVKIDDIQHQLFFLSCGARNCAGIDPDTKVIYYFPQNGHSYQLPELKAK